MTEHDIPAIQERIKRLHPNDGGLNADVALIVADLLEVSAAMIEVQLTISKVINQLGRTLRGTQPDSDLRSTS